MPRTRAVDREALEAATLEHLQTLSRRYRLAVSTDRHAMIEAILSHMERYGGEDQKDSRPESGASGPVEPSAMDLIKDAIGLMQESAAKQQQGMLQLQEMQQQQQQFMLQVISQFMDRERGSNVPVASRNISERAINNGAGPSGGTERVASPPRLSPTVEHSVRSSESLNNGNAIKWLATQIPEFSGSEQENVTAWVNRVERVAQIHGASEGVVLLAASSKLSGFAKQWYDIQVGVVIESWGALKTELTKVFVRRVPFYKAIQKVEMRKWNPLRETFDQYAIAKLAMMHHLNLSIKDSIHLLVGGINSGSLRATALSLVCDSMEDFLERMRCVSEGFANSEKKITAPSTAHKFKDSGCRNCGKRGHSHKDCRGEVICFYCKSKGHRQYDCPKVKDRSKTPWSSQSRVAQAAAAVEDDDSGREPVAFVTEEKGPHLELSGSIIKVDVLGGQPCNLSAMLDTGSPVSFVKFSTYKQFIEPYNYRVAETNRKFINIKQLPLDVIGVVSVDLSLQLLKNKKMIVNLYVIKDQAFASEIILGRDFILDQRLTVVYKLHKISTEKEVVSANLFTHLPLNVEEDNSEDLKDKLTNSETDFCWSSKEKLIDMIMGVERLKVPTVDDDYTVSVRIKDASIYAYAPRRFAYAEKLEIRKIVDDLLKRDIIQPSISPYCARVIPIRKRNGKLRLCVDLRPLNSRIEKQKYPFPIIEDCLSRLANKLVFTLLDLKDGFHHIKVNKDSMKYFSFATADGQYEYKRLPFGYSEAPAEFQKRLVQILNTFIREEKVIVYIDDVLIPTETVDQNLQVLREVMLQLKKYDLELNYDKCQFLRNKIEYLGYVITAGRITLSARHTEAISCYPRPKNVLEVQRFMGLASFFRKFIRDFAVKSKPLQKLLRKDVNFVFDKQCDEAFNGLKKELTSEPILALYNPLAETELHTDASSAGLGAILLQKQTNDKWSVISYFSKTTNQAESRYHSFELETLAIIRAVERFHLYLYGLNFKIVTDCNALVYAINKANLNPRIARWTLALQNYTFQLVHRSGDKMKHVDALSRSVCYVNELPLERELEFRQLADPKIREISLELEYQDNDKFKLVDGLVYRKDNDALKFVVPDCMVHTLLRAHHDDMAHQNIEKTFQGINKNFWFPSMRRRVHDFVENCFSCLMANDSTNRFEKEISLYPAAKAVMEILHMDHFGPLSETRDHFKHIFVIVDAFTRFAWLCPVKTTASREVIKHLKVIFATFGNPSNIVSDRGTAFTSKEFSEFLVEQRVKHRKVAVASPWSNGIVERVNRFVKSSLTKLIASPEQWKDKLNIMQYIINNSHHAVVKSTPAKLMFGYEQRSHADFSLAEFTRTLAEVDIDLEKDRAKAREIASSATEQIRAYNKQYHDSRMKKPSIYEEGEYVLVRDTRIKPGENAKLKPKYKGPFLVHKSLGNNRYVIKDIPGFNITARPYNTVLSADKLKPWVKPVQTAT